MHKFKPEPPARGDCLPTVWAPVLNLAATAIFTLALIWWQVPPGVALSVTSAVGAITIAVVRRARLRDAWSPLVVLAIVSGVALLLITWGFAPDVAISTTSGIGIVASVLTRGVVMRGHRQAMA